jgi:hypothetical protein
MKTALCAAALALLSTSVLASPTGTIVNNFTVSGTAVENNSGDDGITSSSFADFNTALGTLTGVTLSFSGTANFSDHGESDTGIFDDVTTASDVNTALFSGNGFRLGGSGSFPISASGTDSSAFVLSMFEGSGTQALVFNFSVLLFNFSEPEVGSVMMGDQSGTLTYDFTPTAVASVPEPSTWAMGLIGFGLMGLLGYRKTRGALA